MVDEGNIALRPAVELSYMLNDHIDQFIRRLEAERTDAR